MAKAHVKKRASFYVTRSVAYVKAAHNKPLRSIFAFLPIYVIDVWKEDNILAAYLSYLETFSWSTGLFIITSRAHRDDKEGVAFNV